MSAPTPSRLTLPDEVVILIGYRGSGKTTVGRRLAERLQWEFIDTDAAVEEQAGRTIREIFATDGEAVFRRLEAVVLERALAGRWRVIAAGGGAVLRHQNRRAMRAAGTCVWLTAPPAELHRRIAVDERVSAQRPDLTDHPGLSEVETVLQARLPVYEATADQVVDTAGRSVDQVVDAILESLGASQHQPEAV